MAWYNKYRPKNFDEVVGQNLVKSVLQNALIHNRIRHAYLFSGPKGVGKTTLARIFAHQLNNIAQNPESALDIIEMDAASHTGIDDIRLLIESAKTQPIAGKYKIFIIDEVHMLSKSAMNALLKILEEPPHYLIFLLATTNEEKLLPTVLSRLTRLQLTNHSEKDIIARLAYIASNEEINIDEEALKIIAKRSGGSQRDAINLLEMIASYGLESYNANNTSELLGLLPAELLQKTAQNLLYRDLLEVQLLEQIEDRGIDAQEYLLQLLEFLLDQSFAGNEEFDKLILPVAEVISLQLPLTSPMSVLSLVKVKMQSQTNKPLDLELPEKESSETSKVSKIISKKTTSINSENSVNLLQDKTTGKQNQLTNNQSESSQTTLEETPENSQSTQFEKTIKTTNLNPQSLTQFIQKLPYLSGAKPSLKMVATDLKAEIHGQQLVLISSKEVFQGQLKLKEIQDWISDQFEANFGFRPIIVLELRKSEVPLSTTNLEQNPNNLVISSKMNDLTTHPNSILSATTTDNQNSKYFYKIYNQLPEGLVEPVEVIKGPLPLPKKADADWDSHTEELFEFE